MLRIDSHHHLWKFNKEEYPWITGELRAIQNDYLPSDLKAELDKHDIQHSIAVEARMSDTETQFLLKQAALYPFIAGVVGWVDLVSSNLEEKLEQYAAFPELVGFRHRFESDDAIDRGILKPEFINGVNLLGKKGLTYDILCVEKDLPAVIKFAEKTSEQKLVLDHIAKPLIKRGIKKPWDENIRILAQNKNVYCKISGLVTEADWNHWKEEDLIPYLDVVFEAFGTERLMFGSDWPVSTLAAPYSAVFDVVDHYLKQLSIEDQKKIWGLNAKNFYNLNI